MSFVKKGSESKHRFRAKEYSYQVVMSARAGGTRLKDPNICHAWLRLCESFD